MSLKMTKWRWIAISILGSFLIGAICSTWLISNFQVGRMIGITGSFLVMVVLFLVFVFWVGPAGLWGYVALSRAIDCIREGRIEEARKFLTKVSEPWTSIPEFLVLKEQLELNHAGAIVAAEKCEAACRKKGNTRWRRVGFLVLVIIAISVAGILLTRTGVPSHNQGDQSKVTESTTPQSAGRGVVPSVGKRRETPDCFDEAIPIFIGILALLVGFRVIPLGNTIDGKPRVNDAAASTYKLIGLVAIIFGIANSWQKFMK